MRDLLLNLYRVVKETVSMKAFFIIGSIFISITVPGQTKIWGTVSDQWGESIPGANVFLQNTYDGTTSGISGEFEFTTTETSTQILVVKFIGFKEYSQSLELKGGKLEVSVVLKEEVNQLDAVTISAGSFAASDESRRTIFKAVDIVTTAGATADIAGALNTLPGTQKVGETGRLFVRGGDGNETRTFIDGMLVMDAYGISAPNTPVRGRFLPFMFKGTSFSTGGYSAEYGQALSSALVLDSKDEESYSRTDIGLLSVGADVAHTQAWDRGSVAGKVQYTNVRPYFNLINQEIDWKVPPASLEASAAFRNKIGKQGIVKVFGNLNQSDYSLYDHDIDDPSITTLRDLINRYRYVNGFIKTSLTEKWGVRGGLSYTYTNNDMELGGIGMNETDKGLHGKVVFDGSLSDKVEVKAGGEIIHHQYVASVDTSSYTLSFDEVIASTF
ncbi:MAG: TonB-dependent receptor, partial [Cyclobacteriaceae bacterium]|nr:TonB-dependent receptor [Cyclobacteriaceae bacterium]